MECCQVQKNSALGHQRKIRARPELQVPISQWPAQAMIQHVQIPVAKQR